MSPSMYVLFKPTMWCLFLHQAAWEYVEGRDDAEKEDVYYCMYCKHAFVYPTRKDYNPIYRMFQ